MFDPFLNIFHLFFTNPITNVLVGIYALLASLGVPYAFGFSIILLTVIFRIILWPFTTAQIKSAHKMQKIAPHLSAIREKHKGDNKRQQEEIMKLYREHGVNPAAGCLPIIIQFPITIALYNVLNTVVRVNSAEAVANINNILYFEGLKINHLWSTDFFGISLAESPQSLLTAMPYLLLVPVITGGTQFILSKMMMPVPEEVIDKRIALAKKTPQKSDDFQATFQKQFMYFIPAMIAFFSFSLPLGLSLYWNTFTIFGILQQYLLLGPGGAAPIFAKLNIKKKNGKNK